MNEQQSIDPFEIPEFLQLTSAQRKEAWKRYKQADTSTLVPLHKANSNLKSQTNNFLPQFRLENNLRKRYKVKVAGPEFLHGFNYVLYLKRLGAIGQIYPVDRNDTGEPIIGLLVPIQIAYDECMNWSGQGQTLDYFGKLKDPNEEFDHITIAEFTKYLKTHKIFIGDINQFVKAKEERAKKMKAKDPLVLKQLDDIATALDVSTTRIKGSRIEGRKGYISTDRSSWIVALSPKSIRHWTSMKKQLVFMTCLIPDFYAIRDKGEFKLDRMPTADEAETVRKLVGLNKRPELSDERRNALKNQAQAMREAPSENAVL